MNNSNCLITNEIVRIRKLFFAHATFYNKVKFQLSLIFHLHFIILIHQLDVSHKRNF